jgi:negative regulator of flagellin synthesis FlgM
MKISSMETGNAVASGNAAEQKILPKDRPRSRSKLSEVTKAQLTPLEQGILAAEEALKGVPDVREELVAELKEKIEKGEYQVSGEEIADMMMRRLRADRIR